MLCIYVFIDFFFITCVCICTCVCTVIERAEKSIPRSLGLNSAPHNRASGILNSGPSLEFYSSVSLAYCASVTSVCDESMWKNT